jgi:hypothetical protein
MSLVQHGAIVRDPVGARPPSSMGRSANGFFRPGSEREIADLVRYAGANGLKVRVRGAGHSTRPAILTGDFERPPTGDRDVNIMLDRMSRVAFDDVRQQVTVEAGCTLRSLFRQLEGRGWALPTTAGITHQTVGGFLSTGSAGGSLRHSIGGQVVALRLVDGLGRLHELRQDDNPENPFYAAGVSLGLLGIITGVTFQCVDRFRIVGSERTSSYAACEVDLFARGTDGRPDLETFLRAREYARLIWFPQPGVERVTVWQARRLTSGDGPVRHQPYHVVPSIAGSTQPAQVALRLALRLLDPINPPEPRTAWRRTLRGALDRLYPWLAGPFVGVGAQHFQDTWLDGLPMDDQIDSTRLPIEFTELWLPVERAREAMLDLAAYYRDGGLRRTGTFCTEIYATPSSPFWLSPAYQRDVVKINLFWFALNRANPSTAFFPGVWQRLAPYGFRPHWGKVLSGDAGYLRRQYPRWDDFAALRVRYDPRQVFLSEYWRAQLGVTS